MTAAAFLADLETKPEALEHLAAALAGPGDLARVGRPARMVVLLGMGSSRFAAEVAALRLRAVGVDAVAEYSSAGMGTAAGPDTLAVLISASGESVETLEALERHRRRSRTVAITNQPDSTLARGADVVVPLLAGKEASGVACRTFQHTGLVLRALEAQLAERPFDAAGVCRRVAAAASDLLDRREDWLGPVEHALDGPDGVDVLGPAERWSSAAQSALMIREGPRRRAVACETGDWAHVEVYLARSLDYRALLLTGSRWDAQALEWLRRRGSTVVAVGDDVAGTRASVRYAGDHDPEVALHTEMLVAELVAATWWARSR